VNLTSLRRSAGFDVRYNGDPVLQVQPKYTLPTAVTYGMIHPDLVAPFEEQSTRLDAGYTLPEWQALAPEDRAREVALRRLRTQISMLQNAEQQDYAKRRRKKR
jgi:hypothetical protein